MMPRMRLLPVTTFLLVLMLSFKVGNIWTELSSLQSGLQVRPAAAAPEPADAAAEDMVRPIKTAAMPGANDEAVTALPAGKQGGDGAGSGIVRDVEQMSPSEIRLLQDLANRRMSLEERARDLDQREALLRAAEQRLVEKQTELEQIREEIRGLLDQKEGEEQERLTRLVAIYSNMKPKDAARIFNELDMGVLIEVARNMKERKVAPIVAAMEAERARQLTRELAERNELSAEPTASR